jgi:hypothetical protein
MIRLAPSESEILDNQQTEYARKGCVHQRIIGLIPNQPTEGIDESRRWSAPHRADHVPGIPLAVLPPLAWRLNRQGALPLRPDASALPGAPPLAIGAQVRYVSPEEDTSHDAGGAKGDAQLVRPSETR